MSTVRPVVPSNRAVYLHTLKSCSGAFLGEILSVAFMPNGDPVVLTSTGKKVWLMEQYILTLMKSVNMTQDSKPKSDLRESK